MSKYDKNRLPGRKLRRAMLERDNYRCRKCGHHSPDGKQLSPNHVIPYADGGPTELDNLHTLCLMCHEELSWLWRNQPPISYEHWLTITPASVVIRMLIAIRDDNNPHVAAWNAFIGISREHATRILHRIEDPR